ncbi:hypothetical protein LX36DRAFT_350124 [Colletotrichum falcatum]|nr:hypothetical protein LX36DRAFT_350124 [Colletotrichum falcatum]
MAKCAISGITNLSWLFLFRQTRRRISSISLPLFFTIRIISIPPNSPRSIRPQKVNWNPSWLHTPPRTTPRFTRPPFRPQLARISRPRELRAASSPSVLLPMGLRAISRTGLGRGPERVCFFPPRFGGTLTMSLPRPWSMYCKMTGRGVRSVVVVVVVPPPFARIVKNMTTASESCDLEPCAWNKVQKRWPPPLVAFLLSRLASYYQLNSFLLPSR